MGYFIPFLTVNIVDDALKEFYFVCGLILFVCANRNMLAIFQVTMTQQFCTKRSSVDESTKRAVHDEMLSVG